MLRDTYTGELCCWTCMCANSSDNPITIVNEEMICMECMKDEKRED